MTSPAAGYTTRDVPPMTSRSALEIASTEARSTRSSRLSPYSTTSGLMAPPHSGQRGAPSVPMTHSAE